MRPDETLSLSQGKVKVGCWWFGRSVVNYQLLSRSSGLKPSALIWIRSSEPEYGVSEAKDGRVKIDPRMGFSENIQFGHWVVGGSEVNYQLLSRSLRL